MLVSIAKELAAKEEDFQSIRGPGVGNHATKNFMSELCRRASKAFGENLSEKRICGKNSYAVDFYFAAEKTVVEVALGLPSPASEFEKDILKALVAQEQCGGVRRLVFISRAGAAKKCAQPGRLAITAWAWRNHRLKVEVHELPGEPRRRKRVRNPGATPLA